MRRLGERIRKRREILNLPLNDLAKRVGITPSALSQIENAKTFPSIVTLKAIAEHLKTTVGELIGENELITKNPIIKKNDIKLFEKCGDNIEIYFLAQPDASKYMDAYLFRIIPKTKINAETFHLFVLKPHHQIFCHVLSGNFVIILNEVEYPINASDNIYFVQSMFEELQNIGNEIGEMIWVISPSKL
ncbi:MAG: helix-turn-helix domain-containing protein [Bacteroidales bacterium]